MNVLITGGAGFVGSHLASSLALTGARVTVFDNLSQGRMQNIRSAVNCPNVRLVTGNILDSSFSTACRGVDLVYHLAAVSRVICAEEDPARCFDVNVTGTARVLEAARKTGVGRVVFASSREVYGEAYSRTVAESAPLRPKNVYGASKLAAEAICKVWQRRGVETVVLRFTNLYGPHDHGRVIPSWIEQLERGQELTVYGGQQVIDFLPVRHAVAALLASAKVTVSGPINVGSGRGTRLATLAEELMAVAGCRAGTDVREPRVAEVTRFVADVRRMGAILGTYPPNNPLEGLPELIGLETWDPGGDAGIRHDRTAD